MSCIERLGSDRRGIAATEFGLILPVFAMLLLGGFDLSHTIYMQGVMQGEVQKAARKSSLQSGTGTSTQAAIDAAVRSAVKNLNTSMSDSDIVITRRNYKSFAKASAAQAETFTDSTSGIHANGVCDGGEAYTDANNNGVWDADGGDAGQGSAKDITVLSVTASYPHLFPLWRMLGLGSTAHVHAETVLANQPYGEQTQYGTPTTRTCT